MKSSASAPTSSTTTSPSSSPNIEGTSKMPTLEKLRFGVEGGGEVSALLSCPASARQLLVLAHGAGAGMSHPFMENLAGGPANGGVAHLSDPFTYMEQR